MAGGNVLYASISIHAPLTGSDERYARMAETLTLFQSTLPSRGATLSLLIGQ